ncbi:MAG: flagellar hook-length control protein FliK, partial [Betaproteobacteria bacterium]
GVEAIATPRQSGPLPELPVVPKVGSVEWGGAVGEKVIWMANQNHQVAELHLNPPNLGPLEVRLTISNDQASAMFVSPHSTVRDAIETALPRLREMLADNGITLGNASVGAESFGQQQQAFEQRGGAREGGRGVGMTDGIMGLIAGNAAPAGLSRDGMVDIFA